MEQPHDEIHLAIGGQDHQPIKAAEETKTYDKFGDLAKSAKGLPVQVRVDGVPDAAALYLAAVSSARLPAELQRRGHVQQFSLPR